ncbi:solute:sodium symporter family transporter [Mesobacillus subterraneus]|uniref:solute:sodium symporter family transporter n=1 Tax=Mesobacillus subterraneus TaxID=285983 RepID=UPI00273E99DB|nr:solute:sodium symporter family transporter [Mesobacillus subterraneus]WLR54261.1 solute:sodium symporter family transporter [Mesobacillus subterraneus]
MIIGGIGFTLISAAFFMGLVAWYSYTKTKGEVSDSAGYFLAGRGLTGTFIAGSLLLTNLSAEQLVGLNGQAYRTNLSNMAWEVTAAFAIIIMTTYLLPKYLDGNFTTLPEFLSKRFDEGVRQYTVLLFMLGYILVTAPSMLYSGALAVLQLFNVPELFGISYEASVWIVIWTIGIIGAIYAIFGGLKAVAISDTLNGFGLIIIGLLVPILGLIALGDGNIGDGMKQIATTNTEKMNSIGTEKDSVPFGTIFTGMIFANLFYWASNQYVIQRTLGAKNLAEGQKGVLISGFYKLLVPLTMMIPGVIAFHMYGDGLKSVDLAYPALISDVLPNWMSGFFLAVLLGAVLSSFNSLLNSASTMFALDIYKARFNREADDRKLISVSKIAGTLLAIVSLCIAPLLMNAPEGLWDLIRRFTGFFNIPIIAILLVGIFSKRVPSIAAKVVIIFHVITYYMLVWGTQHLFNFVVPIHFIHIYAILFVVEVAIMVGIGFWKPRTTPYTFRSEAAVDMVPWKYTLPVSVILLALVAFLYVVFSPIGLAYAGGYVSPAFWPITLGILAVTITLSFVAVKKWNKTYARYLKSENAIKETKSSPTTELQPTMYKF